jgi:serine/threonine-protein kinase
VDTRDGSFAGEDQVAGASGSFPVEGWDRYEFVRQLGQGGMGAVYEARDRRLGRVVALKFIRGGDPRLMLRLLREARAQAQIDHPNICKVFEIGAVEGRSYIAMQLIDGPRLGEVAGRLSLHDRVRIVRDAALGLHESHMVGVLHRDVKPANILVETTEDGRLHPVVTDFGLARQESEEAGLTESGAILGTPGYMSPEQARGDARRVDRRADVYSLGATLYELLAGAPPFAGSAVDVLVRVLSEDPRPIRTLEPSVPEDLEIVVAKCLSKEPAGRYDSARALAEDLDRYIRGEPILGRRPTLGYRLWRKARRHRGLVATAALSLLAVLVASGLGIRARVLARREAADLEEQARRGRELVADVKDMEWFLRNAHLLPRHDLTREEAIVRERMAGIAESARSGRAANALVAYALGRGHLALREDSEARARFDEALAAGLDSPELQYARGLVLGRLYQRAVAAARRTGEATWLAHRIAELDAEYLAPALASLEKSRGLRLDSPAHLEGLIAFYRKDYGAALGLAARARDEAPWLYEAVALEADVLLASGVLHKDRGENDDARHDLEEAARRYDAAADIAHSDADLALGAAEAWVRLLEMDGNEGASTGARLTLVEERCARAAAIAPARVEAYTKLGYGLFFDAQARQRRGGDPRERYARAADAARRALAIHGGDFDGAIVELGALVQGGQYEVEHGLDPSASLPQALAAAGRVLAIAPRHPWALAGVGNLYGVMGSYQAQDGIDPAANLRIALDVYAQATRVDPGWAGGWSNRLDVLFKWGRYQTDHGVDPSWMRPSVVQAFEGCVRANVAFGPCYWNSGAYHLALAEHRFVIRQDEKVELALASEQFLRARALMPGMIENVEALAEGDLLGARVAVRDGRDPRPMLAALRRHLDDCFRADRGNSACARVETQAHALAQSSADGK